MEAEIETNGRYRKGFLGKFDRHQLERSKALVLLYQWLEDSLREGKGVPERTYIIAMKSTGMEPPSVEIHHDNINGLQSDKNNSPLKKQLKLSPKPSRNSGAGHDVEQRSSSIASGSDLQTLRSYCPPSLDTKNETVINSSSTSLYSPPDLNDNVTEIFKRLVDIYRALGEDRRSFSYYKAVQVIEKFPFKIENSDQIKDLPGVGKSLKDHIHNEKVRTITLFGEVWGIGPATALRLYEKGHRNLDELKNEDTLTQAQRIGLKFFDDIKTRIPHHEVREMEQLVQKVGEQVLPGVDILCGGSYRRGKETCGDMDFIITHPDGRSHIGFLPKFVKCLKDINFLREDLMFSLHSDEVTDSGVDTFFGLCTFPGRELRHRIDLKVYPRELYSFVLIHWTGNDVLNRRLRILADSKGYRLDDKGLFPAVKGSSSNKGFKASASLKFQTEKEVFDFLGFPWLEPHERNL
ncbi:DNA-directed DNA polymerase [Lithospermum erythrorhizon]|uniref:DNA polymerase n=1 Tax=Lithospermum erythrorhizon TaxID=34254 RepID=A0AAV3PTV0_LITER